MLNTLDRRFGLLINQWVLAGACPDIKESCGAICLKRLEVAVEKAGAHNAGAL